MAQLRHLQKTDGLNSFINHSAIISLFLGFRLSISVLPQYSAMIHNHHSVCLHQHPSLFMEFCSQGRRWEKSRERKRQPSSQGQREGYSALYFKMTSQIERMCPCPHISNSWSWGINQSPFVRRLGEPRWPDLNKLPFHKYIVLETYNLSLNQTTAVRYWITISYFIQIQRF